MQFTHHATILALFAGLAASSAASAETWSGKASYYALRGRTASGTHLTASGLTAAHRTSPFGTRLRVVNLANKHETVVTVTDRGPFVRGRVIDVSTRAADILGFRRAGVARVIVETMR